MFGLLILVVVFIFILETSFVGVDLIVILYCELLGTDVDDVIISGIVIQLNRWVDMVVVDYFKGVVRSCDDYLGTKVLVVVVFVVVL